MTLGVLRGTFSEAAFELENPVFEIEAPDDPRQPDFLIRARRHGDEAVFVIEVMGFEHLEYLCVLIQARWPTEVAGHWARNRSPRSQPRFER